MSIRPDDAVLPPSSDDLFPDATSVRELVLQALGYAWGVGRSGLEVGQLEEVAAEVERRLGPPVPALEVEDAR